MEFRRLYEYERFYNNSHSYLSSISREFVYHFPSDKQEQLLAHERMLTSIDSAKVLAEEAKSINQLCDDIKKKLIKFDTGLEINPATAYDDKIMLTESIANDYFSRETEMSNKIDQLRTSLSNYNQKLSPGMAPLPDNLDSKELRTVTALEGLVRIQLSLLQNTRVAR